MAISFGEVYLHSHHPEKLFQFLSFLLDVEASEYTPEAISFIFQSVKFSIVPSELKRLSRQSYFSLSVDSPEELLDLKRNIEFFYYKENHSKADLKIEEDKLTFKDPEGRKWTVLVGKSLNHPLKPSESYLDDVRNC